MEIFFKIFFVLLAVTRASYSFDGFNDMIPNPNYSMRNEAGDPCNPLYWYPRAIPEYCNQKTKPPQTIPRPMLPPPPLPPPAMIPMLVPPLPYGVPIVPAGPMLPVGGLPMPAMAPYPGLYPPSPPSALGFGSQAGLMPGFRGGLSPTGGINVLPFSEAYAGMLEEENRKKSTKLMELILTANYGERVNYGQLSKKSKNKKYRTSRHYVFK